MELNLTIRYDLSTVDLYVVHVSMIRCEIEVAEALVPQDNHDRRNRRSISRVWNRGSCPLSYQADFLKGTRRLV